MALVTPVAVTLVTPVAVTLVAPVAVFVFFFVLDGFKFFWSLQQH